MYCLLLEALSIFGKLERRKEGKKKVMDVAFHGTVFGN